MKFATVE